MAVLDLTLQRIQRLVNLALRLDPLMQEHLQPLVGHSLAVTVLGVPVGFFITFQADHLVCMALAEQDADCHLTAPPLTLMRLLITQDSQLLQHPQVNITGDASLLGAITHALKQFEFDWEEHLSHWTGDMAAHAIATSWQQLRQHQHQSWTSWQQNLSEYLQEETQLLTPQSAIKTFIDDIDSLRLAVDRLEARLDRLQQKRPEL